MGVLAWKPSRMRLKMAQVEKKLILALRGHLAGCPLFPQALGFHDWSGSDFIKLLPSPSTPPKKLTLGDYKSFM